MVRPAKSFATRCEHLGFSWRTTASMLMFALLVSFALGEDAKPTPAKLNRLAGETSPYLLQHAANPVDWQPWSPVALQQARRENKLIFLSIGYSSCHWCHVMERLAFSDQTIAAYLNQNFVCIKVDREERPDLDEVYMLALQGYLKLSGQGGSGGWPLSLFLTPDAQPVAGGSYFPPTDEGGRPGFLTILKQMQTAWSTREKDVRDSAAVLSQFTAKLTQPDANAQKVVAGPALVAAATLAVSAGHDPEFGGFEFDAATPNAPKFPTPSRLQLLQGQIGQDTVNSARFSEQLERTLDHMARGGMHDHLAGGFHRYTVDRRWLQPHFEKMLPDNAQLLEVYLDAARRTGLSTHRAVAERIANFVLQELCDGAGGFHSSLDSDADGVEGQHYTWTKAQLTAVLPATDYTTFAVAYGLDDAQAFTLPAVLHLPRPLHESARVLKVPQSELEARLSEMQGQLLQARRARSPVRKDDKVLTGWNGLMIQALARAGAAWHRTEWVKAAEKAALFLLATHRDSNGDLLRSSRQGAAHIPAYLDDYAYLTGGLLALHEATGEDKWLSAARRLMDTQIRLFWDEQRGGFFFTSSQHESLLVRTRDAYDDALPSPNGVSLRNLVKLARWTHDDRFKELAHRTADAFAPQLQATPANLSTLALGLQENLHWFGQSGPRKLDGNLFADQSAPLVDQLAQGPGPAPAAGDAALVPALKATAEEAAAHKQVSAVIYLDVDKLTPGRKARVAVEMKVARGWHVNANPPSPEFMIPTKLAVKSLGKLELKEIKYPAGKPFRVSGIDEALSVYEGTVYLTATLEVPANWQGNEDLTAELDYQACNDQSCLRPAKLTLTGKLNSSPSPQVVNKALFDKLFPVGRN